MSPLRNNTSQRGYALLTALVLALLYFGLMELALIESTEAARGASRFRSGVTAEILAQNGADLAAEEMVSRFTRDVDIDLPGGHVIAGYRRMPDTTFEILSAGVSEGPFNARRSLRIAGTVNSGNVAITRVSYDR